MKRIVPFLLSLLSGMAWSVIAHFAAHSISGTRTTPSQVGRLLSGGILAAPLIGLLIGLVSRGFSRVTRLGRIVMALGDLYLAAFLFLWAADIEPMRGILLGLTFTGYFLVLWPLSYANHSLIARAWTYALRTM